MPTYRQLKQQIAALEKKAAVALKAEIADVIESIKAQIAEFGLTAADLGLRGTTRRSQTAARKRILPAKYRDPASGKTWSGHGKRPDWFVAAQEKGKAETLLIAPTPAKAALKGDGGTKTKAVPRTKSAPQGKAEARASVKKTQKAAAAKKPAAREAAKKPASARKAAASKPAAKKVAKPMKKVPVPAATPASAATAEPVVAGS